MLNNKKLGESEAKCVLMNTLKLFHYYAVYPQPKLQKSQKRYVSDNCNHEGNKDGNDGNSIPDSSTLAILETTKKSLPLSDIQISTEVAVPK